MHIIFFPPTSDPELLEVRRILAFFATVLPSLESEAELPKQPPSHVLTQLIRNLEDAEVAVFCFKPSDRSSLDMGFLLSKSLLLNKPVLVLTESNLEKLPLCIQGHPEIHIRPRTDIRRSLMGIFGELEAPKHETGVEELIVPTSSFISDRVVSLRADQPCSAAFECFSKHLIRNIPVYDGKTCIGFVDQLDMALFIWSLLDHDAGVSLQLQTLQRRLAQQYKVAEAINFSKRNNFCSVTADAPIPDLLAKLVSPDVKRAAVLNAQGQVVSLVSKRKVLRILARNRHVPDCLIGDVTSWGAYPLRFVEKSASVLDCLGVLFTAKGGACVAVVDGSGSLKCCLDASDVKGLNIQNLMESVEEFNLGKDPPLTCTVDMSFAEVLHRFVKHRAHRIFVVNELGKPDGVITKTDMLRVVLTLEKRDGRSSTGSPVPYLLPHRDSPPPAEDDLSFASSPPVSRGGSESDE